MVGVSRRPFILYHCYEAGPNARINLFALLSVPTPSARSWSARGPERCRVNIRHVGLRMTDKASSMRSAVRTVHSTHSYDTDPSVGPSGGMGFPYEL